MSTLLNILAIMLMVATPLMRPCVCDGFTLFCDCRVETAHRDEACCGGGCSASPTDAPEPHPTPCPDKPEPCGKTLLPDLAAAMTIVDSAMPTQQLVAPGPVHLGVSIHTPVFKPVFDSHPPPAVGILVAHSQFLRI